MNQHRDRIEEVYHGSSLMMNQINIKLKAVDETEKVKQWLMVVLDQ